MFVVCKKKKLYAAVDLVWQSTDSHQNTHLGVPMDIILISSYTEIPQKNDSNFIKSNINLNNSTPVAGQMKGLRGYDDDGGYDKYLRETFIGCWLTNKSMAISIITCRRLAVKKFDTL